ncbi:MAG: NAD-dependent epimerase/dehydratase family protein [Lachnospiraceae bacterium]|nr:NAD-dependent epimerase/dehydratase family protein [Lachnospiraceae bacterium]
MDMKILVTGGTVFVSKYVAEYFVKKGEQVWVLNRNSRPQIEGVTLIEADRNRLSDKLKDDSFDVILYINAYTAEDVTNLLDSGVTFGDYVLISSSAVYPEYGQQPFTEESEVAENQFWGQYGTDKIEAEEALLARVPGAYILRPPYLYGKYNDVYREAFVFDCAEGNRKFYLPGDGSLKLQFFHVEDLCRVIEGLLTRKSAPGIFNVGNEQSISIREWVELCYRIGGKEPEFVQVDESLPWRRYFCFSNYEYYLDVTKQKKLIGDTGELEEGLREAYDWYVEHRDEVDKRPYLSYIDENLSK